MFTVRPRTKIVFSFILSFLVTYAVIIIVMSQMTSRQLEKSKKESKIIQEEIQERFNLFLDITLFVGQISSEYIKIKSPKESGKYGELVGKILKEKEYILGINELNIEGKIVNIYPAEANREAIGKVSQNYPELITSFARGERYWFSPPFKLFQDGNGFVFYIPIVKDNKLRGWIAPVISTVLFFDRFQSISFFAEFDLDIQDEMTGSDYFSTGIVPNEGIIEVSKKLIRGRSIIFKSWPKKRQVGFSLPFSWTFCICFLISGFIAFVVKTHFQKKKAYSSLENISDLLKLTSKEAMSKLADIQSDYLVSGRDSDVSSVTNLIEQIDLLQNIAETKEVEEEKFDLLPLLLEQMNELEDVIKKKKITLEVDSASFKDVCISGNKWLISNTVFKNSLSYCALISRPASKIKISHHLSTNECSTTFQIEEAYEGHVFESFKIERRLLVARNVMSLLNGDLIVQSIGPMGLMLKLTLKV